MKSRSILRGDIYVLVSLPISLGNPEKKKGWGGGVWPATVIYLFSAVLGEA